MCIRDRTTTTQTTPKKAHLALADGTIFTGISVGAEGETTGEACLLYTSPSPRDS